MATTELNKPNLDIYFNFLNSLDKKSKRILISKLNESLDIKKQNNVSISELFGAWKDTRNADVIINDIRKSYINKTDIEEL